MFILAFVTFYRCYGNKNGGRNSLKIEKLPFWPKCKAFMEADFFKN